MKNTLPLFHAFVMQYPAAAHKTKFVCTKFGLKFINKKREGILAVLHLRVFRPVKINVFYLAKTGFLATIFPIEMSEPRSMKITTQFLAVLHSILQPPANLPTCNSYNLGKKYFGRLEEDLPGFPNCARCHHLKPLT